MPSTNALARSGLGELARRRGDLRAARHLHEQALATTTTGWVNAGARSHVLTQLGRVAEDEGSLDEARALYREAVNLASETRAPAIVTAAAEGLARLSS